MLAEAFSDFIAASARLESSYRDLQDEVAELSKALLDRNQALLESRSENKAMGDRLKHIVESIPCGVMVLEEDGGIWLANPEATRLLNLSERACHEDTRHSPGLNLKFQTPTLGEETEQELCFNGSNGTVWLAIRRVQLPLTIGESTTIRQVVLTLRDITARKSMEAEREAARDSVALAQVSAILAHEIRNPLASMELFAGLLSEDPERATEWLSHLRAGIRSLSGTVNNVLTLHGETALLIESIDVVEEVRLAVEFLQPMAGQAEVELLAGAEGMQNNCRARGNRGALHQILLNLCANAMRHTSRGGIVKVICGGEPESLLGPVRIEVRDTGCGIPADQLPRIFEVGFSGSGATSGLGLAVCKRLAQQMNGLLSVSSAVHHGSSFVLELPRA